MTERNALALILFAPVLVWAQSVSLPSAAHGSANASGIVFTCDANVQAVAGVCDKLNGQIAGLYASAFSNATASIYIRFGDTGLGESEFYLARISYARFRGALEKTVSSVNDVTGFSNSVTVTNPIDSSFDVLLTAPLARTYGITGFGILPDGNDCTLGTSGCYDGLVTISSAMPGWPTSRVTIRPPVLPAPTGS